MQPSEKCVRQSARRPFMHLLKQYLFCVALGLGWMGSASAAPVATGKIVYTTWLESGNREIMVMNADGSHKINVSRSSATDYFPQWSPDGAKILFFSTRGSKNGLYVVNADGSDLHCVQNDLVPFARRYQLYAWAGWSPDGRKIAFTSLQPDGKFTLFIIGADGRERIKLGDDVSQYSTGTWSPDSRFFAFSASDSKSSRSRIFIVSADGKTRGVVTSASINSVEPQWSPDGRSIAFVRYDDNYQSGIWVMDTKGRQAHPVSGKVSGVVRPRWNPNGRQLSFGTYVGADYFKPITVDCDGSHLRVAKGVIESVCEWSPDGAHLLLDFYSPYPNSRYYFSNLWSVNARAGTQQLTSVTNYRYSACWSPDSRFIAYTLQVNGQDQIFTMNADGTNQINISNSSTFDYGPSWSRGRVLTNRSDTPAKSSSSPAS